MCQRFDDFLSLRGSMSFIDMEAVARSLEMLGCQTTPSRAECDLSWSDCRRPKPPEGKKSFIDGYLAKIRRSDVVLIDCSFEQFSVGFHAIPYRWTI